MVGKDLIMATLFGGGSSSSGSGGGGSGGSAGGWPEVPDDGATYLYISLAEGRTSPMLGVGVNGTVTVDWGDGTEPDVLTGTSTSTTKWTPNHAYAAPGDYVIRLALDGEMKLRGGSQQNSPSCILRHASGSDERNRAYASMVHKVKIGNGVTAIDDYAFYYCYALKSVAIPDSVTSIGERAFYACYSLASVTIPDSVTSIGETAFSNCNALASVTIQGNASIGDKAFYPCYGVAYYDFTAYTTVPTLPSTSVFIGIPADCEIRVPAALYDEWIAATNWATYAAKIKAY